jgi:hypothetical protein
MTGRGNFVLMKIKPIKKKQAVCRHHHVDGVALYGQDDF